MALQPEEPDLEIPRPRGRTRGMGRHRGARLQANARVLALFGGGVPREIVRNVREVLLRFKKFHEPEPAEVAVFLLRRRVIDAVKQADRVPISGEKSLELYGELQAIAALLEAPRPAEGTGEAIRSRLDHCLALIDPGDLHLTVTASAEPANREDDSRGPWRQAGLGGDRATRRRPRRDPLLPPRAQPLPAWHPRPLAQTPGAAGGMGGAAPPCLAGRRSCRVEPGTPR